MKVESVKQTDLALRPADESQLKREVNQCNPFWSNSIGKVILITLAQSSWRDKTV